jgi:hypothetical protein
LGGGGGWGEGAAVVLVRHACIVCGGLGRAILGQQARRECGGTRD